MSNRFFGRRFGDVTPVVTQGQQSSGIYPIDNQYYGRAEGGWSVPTSMDASGGTKTNYAAPPGQNYQSHTFTAPGTLVVSGLGNPTNPADYSKCEYLIVGGGGGGGASGYSGYHATGGGGGGQIKSNAGSTLLQLAVGTYDIAVGEGGVGGDFGAPGPATVTPGTTGGTSGITSPLISPAPTNLQAAGGGGANGSQTGGQPPWAGTPGGGDASGSGCGGSPWPTAAPGQSTGAAPHPNATDLASPPTGFGAPGGGGPQNSFTGGGGGGAVQPGSNSPTNNIGGAGGNGAIYTLKNGAPSTYAGGGGGGGGEPGIAPGGYGGEGGTGGGGDGVTKENGFQPTDSGTDGTGGGGGGGAGTPGGNGGSGTVIIRWMTNE